MVKAWIKAMGVAIWVTGFLCGSSPAGAETAPEKIRDIRKLLEVSGIEEQLGYMKDRLLNSYGSMINAAYPKAPDAFWKDFYALIGDKEMESLMEQVIPVYDKHMTHDVIRKLITMFENPFWEEWKTKMPIISREAGVIGSQWGQELIQSDAFVKKVDTLIAAHQLEKLNPSAKEPKPPTKK